MGSTLKEKRKRQPEGGGDVFPEGRLYKLPYWCGICGPVKHESPYMRMQKKDFWYVRMRSDAGQRKE